MAKDDQHLHMTVNSRDRNLSEALLPFILNELLTLYHIGNTSQKAYLMQCAAVSTQSEEMRVPPQTCLQRPLLSD